MTIRLITANKEFMVRSDDCSNDGAHPISLFWVCQEDFEIEMGGCL